MRQTTKYGLTVWDLTSDLFDHTQLAQNWDTIDGILGSADHIQILDHIPTNPPDGALFAGRVCMLSATVGGFQAWTMIRYDGSAWRPVGSIEVQPSLPTQGNFNGRVVILSADTTNFAAWSLVRYDGTNWGLVGAPSGPGPTPSGWDTINTGSAKNGNINLNIKGVVSTGDAYISDAYRGFILIDRVNGNKVRLFFSGNQLYYEVVT